MGPLLAGFDALTTYLQDDELDRDKGEQALAYATSVIQGECGQTIFLVTDDTVEIGWPLSQVLVLPERPVVAVGGLSLRPWRQGSYVAAPGSWQLTPDGRLSLLDAGPMTVGQYAATVIVTYTHGFAEVPYDLQAVCVGVAARTLHRPAEALAEVLDAYQKPRSLAGPAALTDAERRICGRYRLGSIGWAGARN